MTKRVPFYLSGNVVHVVRPSAAAEKRLSVQHQAKPSTATHQQEKRCWQKVNSRITLILLTDENRAINERVQMLVPIRSLPPKGKIPIISQAIGSLMESTLESQAAAGAEGVKFIAEF